jgi:hypothetical protein
METKPCNRCGIPAEVSLCVLLSSVNRSPRLQKSTKSIALCSSCLTAWTSSNDAVTLPELKERVNTALDALTRQRAEAPDCANASAVEYAAKSQASCRRCLIACNSRQFDEIASGQEPGE